MLVLFAAAALQPNIIYLRFTDTGIVSIYTELSKASKYLNIDAFNILKLQTQKTREYSPKFIQQIKQF